MTPILSRHPDLVEDSTLLQFHLESWYTFGMSKTYFQGYNEHPQHISVGAVIINNDNEVCCHHFNAEQLKGYWVDEGLDDFYLLMRETLHPNDSLEDTLYRGMLEEFGVTGEMIDYIGSIQSHFDHKGVEVAKTTLYFLCRLKDQDLTKRDTSDIEGETEVEWRDIDFLIPQMKKQAEVYKRTDVDESSILERTKKYLESSDTDQ